MKTKLPLVSFYSDPTFHSMIMHMPRSTILLVLLGLAGGVAARRLSHGGSPLTAALSRDAAPGSLPGKSNAGAPNTAAVTGATASRSRSHPSRRLSPGEILDLRGMERHARFGEWLVTATTAELREFIVALPRARVTGSTLADAIFLRWAELDVEEAVAYGTSHGYSLMAWWSWGKLDPEAALAAAAARQENANGAEVLRAIAQMDPERGRLLMERYPQFIQRGSLEGLSFGLSKTVPKAGAEMWLRAHSSTTDTIVKGWAFKDPEAAVAWASQIKSPAQRNRAMSVVVAQLETSSPEQAGSAIQSMPPGITRNSLMVKHAAQLAMSEPASGIDYALRLEVPGVRQSALASISNILATDRPMEAIALLRDMESKGISLSVTPTGRTLDSLSATMEVLGRTAPEEALKFISSLTRGDGASLSSWVFASWSNADIGKASGWLAAQPQEQREGECVSALISHLLRDGPDQDPEAAVRWSLSAFPGDGDKLTGAFQAWHRRDPIAARQALDLPGVPESVRTALTTPPP